MTAVVAILNKQGVAIAADSAVTLSDGERKKIYLNANKIFTLSKYHPVSILIYNSAEFNGVPWEIVIKEYRNYLGSKNLDRTQDYYRNFLEFLQEFRVSEQVGSGGA